MSQGMFFTVFLELVFHFGLILRNSESLEADLIGHTAQEIALDLRKLNSVVGSLRS